MKVVNEFRLIGKRVLVNKRKTRNSWVVVGRVYSGWEAWKSKDLEARHGTGDRKESGKLGWK